MERGSGRVLAQRNAGSLLGPLLRMLGEIEGRHHRRRFPEV